MIRPLLADAELLADIAEAENDEFHFHLWWLGQSGFLLKWRHRFLLFDPYLSDSLTTKYAATDKPHVRMTERCIAPELLGFVDAVVCSHAHTDHLDGETLRAVAKAIAVAGRAPLPVVIPEAERALASERLGQEPATLHGLDAGLSLQLGDFTLTGIPAAHNTVELDAAGHCRFLGYIVKFGPWVIYHSGDTLWHADLPKLLCKHQPDLVLLPINGNDPARRVAGNLNGQEAAELATICGASMVIPHHFEMFSFNTVTPELFVNSCLDKDQPHYVMQCGHRWSSQSLIPRSL